MTELNTTKCRKCGKTNLKVYEDGSGFCLDCNDSFANINQYDQNKKETTAGSRDNIFTKNIEQPVVSKWKDPLNHMSTISVLFVFFGLVFIVLGIWQFMLSRIHNIFESHIITFIVCGVLFIISSLSLNDSEYKRAFFLSITIAVLLLFQGLYYLYIDLIEKFDYTCLCPISFLLFIVFSAFLFLKMDKKQRDKS